MSKHEEAVRYVAAMADWALVLRDASQSVVERWETPLWKDVPATAEYIAKLRAALSQEPKP